MTQRSEQEAIRFRYTGAGAHLPGIPARDLTDADLVGVDVAEVEASGIYERVDAAARAARSKNEAAPAAKEA